MKPTLLPYQTAFVETVLFSPNAHFFVLRGDVGLGKSTTLAALATQFLEMHPGARALLLAPRMLIAQFARRLADQDTTAIILDRYQFRLMMDSPVENSFWPQDTVVLTNPEFAIQEDIQKSLVEAEWQLVIVDEAHLFRGKRTELVRKIADRTKAIVIASASKFKVPDFCPPDATTVVEWRRQPADFGAVYSLPAETHDAAFELSVPYEFREAIAAKSKPITKASQRSWTNVLKEVIPTPPRPSLRRVTFKLSSAERALQATIGELENQLKDIDLKASAVLLNRSSLSSPAALEIALQRILTGTTNRQVATPASPNSSETSLGGTAETSTSVVTLVSAAVEQIEEIHRDSKLDALVILLEELAAEPFAKICVLTDYLSTLYYIAAELEAIGAPLHLLQGQRTAARDSGNWPITLAREAS